MLFNLPFNNNLGKKIFIYRKNATILRDIMKVEMQLPSQEEINKINLKKEEDLKISEEK